MPLGGAGNAAVESKENEGLTDRLCATLNLVYGWSGAEAEHLPDVGYTGRIVLSLQATARVIADRQRMVDLEQQVKLLTRQCDGANLRQLGSGIPRTPRSRSEQARATRASVTPPSA